MCLNCLKNSSPLMESCPSGLGKLDHDAASEESEPVV